MLDIEISNLTKEYITFDKDSGFMGSIKSLFHRKRIIKQAITNFDFCAERGECIGIIGPNGAGKTTLIKLATGIISPTSGNIKVMGFKPYELKKEFKQKIALVAGQKSQLFFDLSAEDSFLLFQQMYEIEKKEFIKTVDDLSNILNVKDILNRPVRNLSLGERMKMELIAALLHNPPILFLDEPTIGLDCISQRNLRSYLKEINHKKGTTIILTSHYMEDVKDLCNRCIVINSGRKINDENIDSLLKRYNSKKIITIYLRENNRFPQLIDGCEVIEKKPHKVVFAVQQLQSEKIGKIIMNRDDIIDILIEDEDIASIIERVYNQAII